MRRPLPQSDDYARWLSQIAECLALVQAQSAVDLGLVLTHLSGIAGILVWDDWAAAEVLHVDAQGEVVRYRPGAWERRLVEAGWLAGDPIQRTLDLAGIALVEIATGAVTTGNAEEQRHTQACRASRT